MNEEITVMKYKNFIACKGSFGENCQYPCSFDCINQTCHRTDGSCLYGCVDGKPCIQGIFLILMNFITIFVTNNQHKCMKSKALIMIYVLNDSNDFACYIDFVISFV